MDSPLSVEYDDGVCDNMERILAACGKYTELEVVIGNVHKSGRFIPGMNFDDFSAFYADLKIAAEADPSGWKISQTKAIHYHYANGIRGVCTADDTMFFVQKTPLVNCIITSDVSPYAYRVHVKREVKRDRLQMISKPDCVRLIERWSFKSSYGSVYDLSKVSQGSDQDDACSKDPIFEFEMEFTSPQFSTTRLLDGTDQQTILVGEIPNQCTLNSRLLLERIADISGRFDSKRTPIRKITFSLTESGLRRN